MPHPKHSSPHPHCAKNAVPAVITNDIVFPGRSVPFASFTNAVRVISSLPFASAVSLSDVKVTVRFKNLTVFVPVALSTVAVTVTSSLVFGGAMGSLRSFTDATPEAFVAASAVCKEPVPAVIANDIAFPDRGVPSTFFTSAVSVISSLLFASANSLSASRSRMTRRSGRHHPRGRCRSPRTEAKSLQPIQHNRLISYSLNIPPYHKFILFNSFIFIEPDI